MCHDHPSADQRTNRRVRRGARGPRQSGGHRVGDRSAGAGPRDGVPNAGGIRAAHPTDGSGVGGPLAPSWAQEGRETRPEGDRRAHGPARRVHQGECRQAGRGDRQGTADAYVRARASDHAPAREQDRQEDGREARDEVLPALSSARLSPTRTMTRNGRAAGVTSTIEPRTFMALSHDELTARCTRCACSGTPLS